MSVRNVYGNIEVILRRIEEIRNRFDGYSSSASFESELQNASLKAEKTGHTEAGMGAAGVLEESGSDYDGLIEEASVKYNIPTALIRAVIRQESNFDRDAVSPKGAMGLMQLMPSTAEVLGVENAFDAKENIHGGTGYLVDLLGRYNGNINRALAAYNAGPERVKDDIPNIRETKDYISAVLDFYEQYSEYEKGED